MYKDTLEITEIYITKETYVRLEDSFAFLFSLSQQFHRFLHASHGLSVIFPRLGH